VGAMAWLLSVPPGAVTGQFHLRASRVARRWMRHNGTWRSLRYWPPRSWLFWGAAHPLTSCRRETAAASVWLVGRPMIEQISTQAVL
jgi:hypothetical protein